MNVKVALSISIFVLCSFFKLQAQNDSIQYNLFSPKEAILHHMYYLEAASYDPSISALALEPNDYSPEELEELALKLKQIYIGSSHYIDPDDLPENRNHIDSTSMTAIYKPFPYRYPDIYVKKKGNQWRYSNQTVNRINYHHRHLFPFGSELLMKLAPKKGQSQFMGLQLWQYLALSVLIVTGAIAYKILDWLTGLFIGRLLPRLFPDTQLAKELIPPVAHPLSLLLVVMLLDTFLPALLLPPNGLGKYLSVILQIARPVFAVIVVYRLVNIFSAVFANLAGRTSTTMDDQLVPLVTKATKLVVIVLGLIFVLDNLEVDVTALLAGISIGGLALALAAQDTVKNFIGSISIFIDRPFMIGDYIDTGSFAGTVEEVGVRSTRIRSSEGPLISIPNGKLMDMVVTNHGVRTFRRYKTTLGLTYDATPKQMEDFVEGVREIVRKHPSVQEDGGTVYFHEMADSALNVYFSVMFDLTEFTPWLEAKQEILLEIIRLAEKIGVSFAFPSTSIYVENLPEPEKNT